MTGCPKLWHTNRTGKADQMSSYYLLSLLLLCTVFICFVNLAAVVDLKSHWSQGKHFAPGPALTGSSRKFIFFIKANKTKQKYIYLGKVRWKKNSFSLIFILMYFAYYLILFSLSNPSPEIILIKTIIYYPWFFWVEFTDRVNFKFILDSLHTLHPV